MATNTNIKTKVTLYYSKNQATFMIIESIFFLTIGILFCCSVSVGKIVDITLGIILLVCALYEGIMAFIAHKSFINAEGLSASFFCALSIVLFTVGLSQIIDKTIIWFLIVLGSMLILNGLIGLIFKRNPVYTISEIVIGAISLTFGLCLYLIPDFARYSALILGIIFILLGVALLATAILRLNGKRVK